MSDQNIGHGSGSNEGGEITQRHRRDMPNRTGYDYLRGRFGTGRTNRLTQLDTRFDAARDWINPQLSSLPEEDNLRNQFNLLTNVDRINTASAQSTQGNDRFFNRDSDRPIRQ